MPTWLIITLSIIYVAIAIFWLAAFGAMKDKNEKENKPDEAKIASALAGCAFAWPIALLIVTTVSLLRLLALPFKRSKDTK